MPSNLFPDVRIILSSIRNFKVSSILSLPNISDIWLKVSLTSLLHFTLMAPQLSHLNLKLNYLLRLSLPPPL